MAQQELTLKDILLKAQRWMEIIIEDENTSAPDILEATSDLDAINAVLTSMESESENVLIIPDIPRRRLGNIAYSGLIHLMDHGITQELTELEGVLEAEMLLQFKKAIAMEVDSIVIRFEKEATNGTVIGTPSAPGEQSDTLTK